MNHSSAHGYTDKHDATYIKVKEGKLWASDMVKPILYKSWSIEEFDEAMEAFNQSFIEVGNAKEAAELIMDLTKQVLYSDKDSLIPVSGLQFEVRRQTKKDGDYDWFRKVAILSLKQEQPSEEKEAKRYTVEEILSRLRQGLSKFGCKSTIAGKWILEDNIYHVLREIKD